MGLIGIGVDLLFSRFTKKPSKHVYDLSRGQSLIGLAIVTNEEIFLDAAFHLGYRIGENPNTSEDLEAVFINMISNGRKNLIRYVLTHYDGLSRVDFDMALKHAATIDFDIFCYLYDRFYNMNPNLAYGAFKDTQVNEQVEAFLRSRGVELGGC